MEEILEAIVAIIIVIAAATAKSRKKKKRTKKASFPKAAQAEAAMPAAAKTVAEKPLSAAGKAMDATRAAVGSMFEELPDVAKEILTEVKIAGDLIPQPSGKPKSASLLKSSKRKPASGESTVDEHGCIGGSLGKHNAEGEAMDEHAAHLPEVNLPRQTSTTCASAASHTRMEMRRAVMWSEILDKPISLRE